MSVIRVLYAFFSLAVVGVTGDGTTQIADGLTQTLGTTFLSRATSWCDDCSVNLHDSWHGT